MKILKKIDKKNIDNVLISKFYNRRIYSNIINDTTLELSPLISLGNLTYCWCHNKINKAI